MWPPWNPWVDPSGTAQMQPGFPPSMPLNPAMLQWPMPYVQNPMLTQMAPTTGTMMPGLTAAPATAPAAALSPQPPAGPPPTTQFDPWASAAAAARQAGSDSAGTGNSPGPGGVPSQAPPMYPAPGTFPNLQYANDLTPAPFSQAPGWSPPGNLAAGSWSPNPAQNIFTGGGATDASKTVTGITAEYLLDVTRQNIADRVAKRIARVKDKNNDRDRDQHGKKECPTWDGQDPGKTLRPWLRSQLHWQIRTPSPPEQWGILLYESLPKGTLSRTLAETVTDRELMTADGYVKILMHILQAHQAYLEVELEKATVDFIYPRQRERNELFTTYVAYLELLCRELDNQLKPAPPMDERIKAIILLRNVQLEKDQRTQLALKRAGQQSFQEVADLLRTLDRPEAFLRATAQGPPVQAFLNLDRSANGSVRPALGGANGPANRSS